MGEIPVSHENIAHIESPQADLVKPGLILVVLSLEFVRPYVGTLISLRIDKAEVDKTPKGIPHIPEDGTEPFLVDKILE
jgi:hypothetical protein